MWCRKFCLGYSNILTNKTPFLLLIILGTHNSRVTTHTHIICIDLFHSLWYLNFIFFQLIDNLKIGKRICGNKIFRGLYITHRQNSRFLPGFNQEWRVKCLLAHGPAAKIRTWPKYSLLWSESVLLVKHKFYILYFFN